MKLSLFIDPVKPILEFREREPLQGGDPREILAPYKVKQLQVLIRKGAKDMTQDWRNAVHLCNKAYKVMGHKIPSPLMKDGWAQYEYLLAFTVGVLSSTRGPAAKWRASEPQGYDNDIDAAVERSLRQVPGYVDTKDIPGYDKIQAHIEQ